MANRRTAANQSPGLLWVALILTGCTPRATGPPRALPADPNLQIALATRPASPRQLDPTQFLVTLKDAQKRPVSGATVTADLAMPGMDMGHDSVTLTPGAAGVYVGTGRFTMPGDWQVTVTTTRGRDRAAHVFSLSVR